MFVGTMMGGVFTVIGNLISILGDLLTALFNFLLFLPMVLILAGVMLIAFFAEMVFKKLAGIDTIYLGNTAFGGANNGGQDLVFAFITEPSVQDVFWSILALSFVLLFIFTIVALIKSEFTLDLKGSAKGPIISRALKSLANFIIVPVTALISIIGVNYLTKTVYDLFGTTGDSVVTKCFYVGAYNANRARLSSAFADSLSNNEDFDGKTIFSKGADVFSGKSQDQIAYIIDQYFLDGTTGVVEYTDEVSNSGYFGRVLEAAALDDGYINFALIFFGYPNDGDFNMLDATSVNYYYDLTQFDFILAIGSAICMAWILLTTCLVLVKRVFELTILFLLSPAMIAIAPLDGGQAEKKWRQEFMKRLLAVIGPIFAFNMYFLLVPLFSNISLFGSEGFISPTIASGGTMLNSILLILASFYLIFDIFFQLVCVITGMSIVKSASALLSNLLGIEDLVKSGGEAAKKAVDTGKKAALLATGVGGVAVKGAAAALKVGGRVAGKAGKGISSGVGKVKDKIHNDRIDKRLASVPKEQREAEQQKIAEEEQAKQARKDERKEKWNNFKSGAKEKIGSVKEFAGNVKDGIKKGLGKAGFIAEDVSGELEEFDAKHKDDIDSLDSAKNTLSELEEKRKNLTDEGDLARNREAIEAAKKVVEERQTSWDETQKERKRIEARGKGLYQSEFGEDSNVTSTMAQITEKINSKAAKFKNVPLLNKIPELTNSWAEQFQINGETAKRRLNDGLAGMFGDSGGGDLWKIWFNKNARANLYEGVPESKRRTSGIEQGLSWGARDAYYKKEEEKKARDEQERLIRRMLAQKRGNSEYEDLIKKRETETNPTQISKLDAKIDKMEITTGIKADAKAYYDNINSGGRAKELQEFKDKMEKDASVKAYGKDVEAKAKAEAAKSEWVEQQAKVANQTAIKTKQDEADRAKMAEEYGKAVKNALKNSKIGLDETALQGFADRIKDSLEGMNMAEMAQAMNSLVEALSKLK